MRAAAVHAIVEFVGVALCGFLAERFQAGFFEVVVRGAEGVILEGALVESWEGVGSGGGVKRGEGEEG